MAKEVIAADYDNVKSALNNMDREIADMLESAKSLETTIKSTTNWQGIDAEEYQEVLARHIKKIRNSARWLEKLNDLISKHAQTLYNRALEDQNANTFR